MPVLTTIADVGDSKKDRIVIIGAGIVGCALASNIAASGKEDVLLIDRSFQDFLGSTGHAPGFVGQYNDSLFLSQLAKWSVEEYMSIPGGFQVVGGLELATTAAGAAGMDRRCDLAREAGIPAELISSERAASLAPELIKHEDIKSALFFPSDGIADAKVVTTYFRRFAERHGARLLEADVQGLEFRDGLIRKLRTNHGELSTESSQVTFATGVWTKSLLSDISGTEPVPIIPVAHPYGFTARRPRRAGQPYPFVRWPEYHVYARDHGDRDGMGSYDHKTVWEEPGTSAIGAWRVEFESVLAVATEKCLKNAKDFFAIERDPDAIHFNGIFSVTPDNLPLAGKVRNVENMWLCAAVWVTHAAGTAKLVSKQILGKELTAAEAAVSQALDPNRFAGMDFKSLAQNALGRYNDIYNSQTLDLPS
ncbi:FAD dependent oxidoreductase [Lipomyces kononenkoae]|uniref:FAD dependent oxidoreductase n=1 Tax=Lipomyces kononenkoae TaxID=34357 RepID=A0ACC3T5R9_LIPKO